MTQVLLQGPSEPASELYRIVHRIADRLEPEYRDAFLSAVESAKAEIDVAAVRRAYKTGGPEDVMRALQVGTLSQTLREPMARAFERSTIATGQEVGEEFSRTTGVNFAFDATDPNAIMAARREAATLVSRVSDETRQTLRAIVADMQTSGVPPAKAAPRIRAVVGLRENQARAVGNFVRQLRDGDLAATSRRLDAATRARIRSRIEAGTVTEEFIEEVQETYATSLNNRRALDIARTETIRAGQAGQQETWRQAADRGVLDRDRTRRVWIVTPDDRLRPSHAAIPGMNPGGVRLEEPFATPMGAMMGPPAGVNCRCSTGLMFTSSGNVL